MEVSYIESGAIGYGLATVSRDDSILDTWFPCASLCEAGLQSGTHTLSTDEAVDKLGERAIPLLGPDHRRDVYVVPVQTTISDLGQPPGDAFDLFLRLHLLSMRLIRPHQANLSDFLNLLTEVAWTSIGPCLPARMDELLWLTRRAGTQIEVRSTFKVPRMTEYVVPDEVWIADANRVFLGAHLSRGTTVLPEGFCAPNAGTLGPCMVEGRISVGVTVGGGTDIWGGASIMGTTSGGGKHVVAIGENCLLGANSGLGISLGDNCTVEAGLYLTAGTRVLTNTGEVVKALELSGKQDLLFRRNSTSGQVECLPITEATSKLNPVLHRPAKKRTLHRAT